MVRSGYPKRIEPSRHKEALVIYGVAGPLGFAATFAIAWFAPSAGWGLLAAPLIYFAFGKDYSKWRTLRLVFELVLVLAAVVLAAALK
jgi:hypothetical protein